MIGLAKLVTGRLETAAEQGTPDSEQYRKKDSHSYGISRLGLIADEPDRPEAPRPGLGDEAGRRPEQPEPPASTHGQDAPFTAPAATAEAPPAPKTEIPTSGAPLPPEQLRTSYKKTSVKMPRHLAARLKAYARTTGSYQYSVVIEAIDQFLQERISLLNPRMQEKMTGLARQFEHEENRSRWRKLFSFRSV